jgi:3-hydroxybutyryl-CoA dehydrogenase
MLVDEVRRISVVGAGLMGHGIAQEFALAGYAVTLHDVTGVKLSQAVENMKKNLRMLEGMGLVSSDAEITVLKNIRTTTALEEAAGADVVIEAASEDLVLKQEIFRTLDRTCPPRTIFASNTSTFLPSMLASATRRPERVLVAHYFNPPYLLPLVEVVRHDGTSEETLQLICALLKKTGKSPVVLKKEALGFIGNRLQAALFREALSIVGQGIASAADVDTVVRDGFGRRLAAAGVFEIWEIAGWDLISSICHNLFPTLDASEDVPPLLKGMVERGELGVKSGKGFYDWTPEAINQLKERIAGILVTIAHHRDNR